MTNAENIYQTLKNFFTDSAIIVLAIMALLFLLRKTALKYKYYILGLVAIAFFVFNDVTYWIMSKLGEGDTFYRFLWIAPVTVLASYFLIELWDKLQGMGQKILYVSIVVLFLYVNGMNTFSGWTNFSENVYQISDEQVETARIINAYKRKWTMKFWDDGTIANGIREYDATIKVALDTTTYMDAVLTNQVSEVDSDILEELLVQYQIDVIGIKKDYEYVNNVFESLGCKKIGETESAYLYLFEWRYK